MENTRQLWPGSLPTPQTKVPESVNRNWSEMSQVEKDEHHDKMLMSSPAFARRRIDAEVDAVLQSQGLRRRSRSGLRNLTHERRNGAKVKYPGCDLVVPSIWTPIKIFPYPNWRKKYNLKPSYLPKECEVLDRGWIPGQKPSKTAK